MKTLLKTALTLSVLMLGANHTVEARSHFSLYLGGPSYVAPYYVAPQYYVEPYYEVPTYYYAPRPYYVAPQPYYYAPRRYYYYR